MSMAAWAQDVCRLAGALLEMAIINWAFQRVAAAGFTPITTPDLVRASVLEKCGFQPRAENTQVRVDPAGGCCDPFALPTLRLCCSGCSCHWSK